MLGLLIARKLRFIEGEGWVGFTTPPGAVKKIPAKSWFLYLYIFLHPDSYIKKIMLKFIIFFVKNIKQEKSLLSRYQQKVTEFCVFDFYYCVQRFLA